MSRESSWVLDAVVYAGEDSARTTVKARISVLRPEPDIGHADSGLFVESAGLELSADVLLMIGQNVDEQFSVDITGFPIPVRFDVHSIEVGIGYLAMESDQLDDEIARYVDEILQSHSQTMEQYA